MATALVIKTDGTVTGLTLGTPDETYQQMRTAIGASLIDVARLLDDVDMWYDDEGFFDEPVLNRTATTLARRLGCMTPGITGTVLVCAVDEEGNSVNLNGEQLARVRAALPKVVQSTVVSG